MLSGTLREQYDLVKTKLGTLVIGMPSTLRLLTYLIAATVAGLSIVFAAAAWRLSAGPVSLLPLTPYLEKAISESAGGLGVRFNDTVLGWDRERQSLEVQAVGVDLIGVSGDVLRLPRISISLSSKALIRGIIAPKSVDLEAPELVFIRKSDGTFDTSLGIESGGWVRLMIDELLRPPDLSKSSGYLQRITLVRADLTLIDDSTTIKWFSPAADVAVLRDVSGLLVDFSGLVFLDQVSASVNVTARYDAESGLTKVSTSFEGVQPNQLATPLGVSFLHAIQAEVSGGANITLLLGDGVISHLDYYLAADSGFIDLPQYFKPPIRFDDLMLRGSMNGRDTLVIEELIAQLGPTAFEFAGDITYGGVGLGIKGKGSVKHLLIDAIPGYWPYRVNPGARAWFATNVSQGHVESGSFDVDIPPEVFQGEPFPDDIIDAKFTFRGAAARYLGEFPLATNISGAGRLTGGMLDASVESAVIDEIKLNDGLILLKGLNTRNPVAKISLVGRGGMMQALELLDHAPLHLAERMDIAPQMIEGDIAARAQFEFPIRTTLHPSEVVYRAAANVRGAKIPQIYKSYGITGGDLLIRAVNGRIESTGPVEINRVPMELLWRRDTIDADRTEVLLSGSLSEADRAALGVSFPTFLSGRVVVDLRGATDGTETSTEVEVDLAGARLAFDAIKWVKPVGVPGKAHFVVVDGEDGGIALRNLAVDAEGLLARGDIAFTSDGSIKSASFNQLHYGQSDMTALAWFNDDGQLAMKLRGQTMDFRPYTDDLFDFATPSQLPSMILDAQFSTLLLGDDLQLKNVDIQGRRDDVSWQYITAGGEFSPGEEVKLSLMGGIKHRQLDISAANAGKFLRTIGYFDNAVGGKLRLRADIHDDIPGSPVHGKIRVDRFHLVEVPALAQVLSLASLQGIVDTLGGEGISFVRFEAPFMLTDNILSIGEARAVGPALGITVGGTVDRGDGHIDLSGTVIPAYTINSLLGNIPILGTILVGRAGEGVFALSYRIRGATGRPQITVNPLTALAPGFLRNFVVGLERGDWVSDASAGDTSVSPSLRKLN